MAQVMATPKNTLLSAFVVGAVLSTGCHHSSSSAPERLRPPANTGTVVIDMNGSWRVTAVEILEQLAPDGSPGKTRANSGMYPLQLDTIVTIQDRLFTKADTWSLRRQAIEGEGIQVYTYLNLTDGRFAFYDLGWRTPADPRIADGGSGRAQLVVGSIDDNTMLGLSAFELSTAPFPYDQPRKGLYRVRLERR
jgi:hypothetical protein